MSIFKKCVGLIGIRNMNPGYFRDVCVSMSPGYFREVCVPSIPRLAQLSRMILYVFVLQSNHTLETLILSHNRLGIEAGKHLGSAISKTS